jgi:hypothetical protein
LLGRILSPAGPTTAFGDTTEMQEEKKEKHLFNLHFNILKGMVLETTRGATFFVKRISHCLQNVHP